MTIPEKAVEFAVSVANDNSHGYDQAKRWGPDYDCSSLVIAAYKAGGVPLASTYTGNMWRDFLDHGFSVPSGVDLATGAGLQPGDVLLNERSHTALYIGNGQIVNAGGNEFGGSTGGQAGDQTGREIAIVPYYNFPWDTVLRYGAEEASGVYIVKSGDTLWNIAERLLGDPWRYHEIEKANNLKNATIYPGQTLIIPGVTTISPAKETLTIEVEAETAQLLRLMAEGWGKTVGEVVDALMEDAR